MKLIFIYFVFLVTCSFLRLENSVSHASSLISEDVENIKTKLSTLNIEDIKNEKSEKQNFQAQFNQAREKLALAKLSLDYYEQKDLRTEAIQLLKQNAEGKHFESQALIASYYQNLYKKHCESQDLIFVEKEFIKWICLLANSQYDESQDVTYERWKSRTLSARVEIIDYYYIKKEYENSFEWLKKSEKYNDSQIYYDLALFYEKGWIGTPNIESALSYYRKAADLDDDQANFALGLFYQCGQYVEKDEVKAMEFYRAAALKDRDQSKAGHAGAQANLAVMYFENLGIAKKQFFEVNYQRAFELAQCSAKQNNPIAFQLLSLCYEQGKGVRRDDEKAIDCCEEALKIYLSRGDEVNSQNCEKRINLLELKFYQICATN